MTDARPAATAVHDALTGPAAARLLFVALGTMLVAVALSGCGQGTSGGDDMSPEAVARRIQPLGTVELREADASGGVAKTGEQVYAAQCTACQDAHAAARSSRAIAAIEI